MKNFLPEKKMHLFLNFWGKYCHKKTYIITNMSLYVNIFCSGEATL